MRVGPSSVEPVPGDPSRVRLSARVSYESPSSAPETYWYEFPAALEPDLDRGGNPWLTALLPLAASVGEPLEWDSPVDRPLLDGAREVLQVWHAWYEATAVVSLRGPVAEEPERLPARRTAAFLSGGVDSFFTALDHGDGSGREERGPIDEFLFVLGFDLPLSAPEAGARVARSLESAAAELGRPLIGVRTNLRETRWGRKPMNWGLWAHGPALASVGMALGHRYRLVLIPASNIYRVHVPWGSHPFTDKCFASWTLRIRDDGAAYDRPDKIRAIAESPVARRHLRVCWKSTDGNNCGRCPKCLQTMLALETVAGLARFPTFPPRLDARLARAMRLDLQWEGRHARRLREIAREAGRRDIVRILNRLLGWRARLRRDVRQTGGFVFGPRGLVRRAARRAARRRTAPGGAPKPPGAVI